jgi:1-acyl-sn-glycerol-3-phosphate acyltransferase
MKGGVERLQKGVSVVVFPQTRRSLKFDPSQFNSIGLKLALRAKVPVIPIALLTDAWSNGTWLKDLGPINPNKRVHIAFGEPITIEGRGAQQHQQIIDYIQSKLSHWDCGPG